MRVQIFNVKRGRGFMALVNETPLLENRREWESGRQMKKMQSL